MTLPLTALVGLHLFAAAPPAPATAPRRAVPVQEPTGPSLQADPRLAALLEEALANRPELKQARARLQAERERVPQAGALPDPMLTLGIQNDGFDAIQIGKMETSYWQVMLAQTFPWFGKQSMRAAVADLGADQADAALERARLTVVAEVKRAYVDLLLVRDQLALLGRLEALWLQSEGLARFRYEAGEAAQSDLLRAQLERTRLRQSRLALEAEERRRVEVLNRARSRSLQEPVPTSRTLGDVPDPAVPDLEAALSDAEARSPELRAAELAARQGERRLALARREWFPDVTVSAGIMPRGSLDPMWLASVSVNLPVWGGSKQSRAVAESGARLDADRENAEAVRQVLRLRVQERLALLGAVVEANRIYRSGLLVQSDATVTSTLAQYRVGRVTFASALEALAGYVNDENGFLASVASAQRLDIAREEVSLEAPSASGAGSLGGRAMPGAGATGAGPAGSTAAPAGAESGGSTSMGM